MPLSKHSVGIYQVDAVMPRPLFFAVDSSLCGFESRQERRENFLLQGQLCVLTFIRCPFHPRLTAVAHKRPWSFCQKCRWQVTPKHAYTFDQTKSEWADYAAVQAQCGRLSGNDLTRNSSGKTLGHRRLSSLSHYGLILA